MPLGFLTEAARGPGSEPHPEFAERYGAREMPTASDPERTRANVRDSDATLWFVLDTGTPGARARFEACRELGRPCLRVELGFTRPGGVAEWIRQGRVRVLNVAGSRESREPGFGGRVERFVADFLGPIDLFQIAQSIAARQ